MTLDRIDPKMLNSFLMKNWMTHDALWYAEVVAKVGMTEASPMNLTYTVEPDLFRCLKFKGQECEVTIKFQF